jgi:hypothetical protein
VLQLINYCDEHDCQTEFLRMCERESAKLMALLRRVVEQRKEQREEALAAEKPAKPKTKGILAQTIEGDDAP